MQISMSAPMTLIAVNRFATTHMDHITAFASVVTNYVMMDSLAEVIVHCIHKCQKEWHKHFLTHCTDIDECATQVDECEQNCHNNNGSYRCSCNAGYKLNDDGFHCDGTHISIFDKYIIVALLISLCWAAIKLYNKINTDVDECAENTDSCDQVCTNTAGSYICSCGSCYRLGSNGYSCNGRY